MRELYLCFQDVARLDGVPAELYQALIERHGGALVAAGVAPEQLATPSSLWLHRSRVPVELVDTLHRLGTLADDAGVDAIVQAAGGPLFAGPLDRVPVVFAVRTWLEHPAAFHRAVGRRLAEAVFRFREFVGRDRDTACLEPDVGLAAGRIGAMFGRRGRGEDCRVHDWLERDRNRYFAIEHAGIPRIDRALVDGVLRTVTCMPVEHDLVVYDARLGRLRVSASDPSMADAYMRLFGDLLFSDEEWFHRSVVVTLDPLRGASTNVLRPTAGVLEARVVRLEVASRTTGSGVVVSRAPNVLRMLSEQLIDSAQHGPARAATFRLRLVGEDRLRDVAIELPDQIEWDWRRHNAVIRTFLEERGFLRGVDGGVSWKVA